MKRYKTLRFPRLRPANVSFASRLRSVAEQKSGRPEYGLAAFRGLRWLRIRWGWSMDRKVRARQA